MSRNGRGGLLPRIDAVAGMRDTNHRTTLPLAGTAPESGRPGWYLRWIHPAPRPDTPLADGLSFGRGARNSVVLEGDSTSREHARIVVRAGTILLEDLKSRNGTFRDRTPIELAPIVPGSVLRFGEWLAVVIERPGEQPFGELAPGLSGSERLAAPLRRAAAAASSALPLLVIGETGTGKELVCRAIHEWSGRKGRLVAVNSAALSDSLLDAELFGHEPGAFTGATGRRVGLVREADHGSLFLDEVAELSPLAQAKLLRVLQESEVLPVGGSRQQAVDLRVLAATHRDLGAMIRRGTFRSDLYARLSGLTVELPALRRRREDILPLFSGFVSAALGRTMRCSPRFVEALCCYDWPRNVRELKQCAERLAALHPLEPAWHVRHLVRSCPELEGTQVEVSGESGARVSPRERTREDVHQALVDAGGNIAQAARSLQMSRESLYKLIRDHGISLTDIRRRDATDHPERRQ